MSDWPQTLALAGAGKMGGAMLRGWLDGGLAAAGVDRGRAAAVAGADRACRPSAALPSTPPTPRPAEVFVLAVKPQALDAAAPSLQALAGPDTLVISVIAGKTIADLRAALFRRARVRAGDAEHARRRRARRGGAARRTTPSARRSAAGRSG